VLVYEWKNEGFLEIVHRTLTWDYRDKIIPTLLVAWRFGRRLCHHLLLPARCGSALSMALTLGAASHLHDESIRGKD
jgi:hypothetical protein